MSAKVHPELQQQLDQADGLIQAVLQLRFQQEPVMASPSEVQEIAQDILKRAETAVGHPATRANVLRNLGVIIVEGSPDYVRSLINQPEVVTAGPNQTAAGLFIPPKGRRPA